jgi:hypothetical protein
VTGCPCASDLNILVCRTSSCTPTDRFIASAPFIAGALAVFASGAIARFTIDRLLDRRKASEADSADFADFIAEATGLVGAFLLFVMGLLVVISSDKLQATVVLVAFVLLIPLGWPVWRFVSQKDPIRSVRKKRGRVLGWCSYMMAAANALAVLLVFFVI